MRSRRRKKPMSDMNVVPYIDVMLVLLVIFMVTAPMMQAGVMVELPDVDASPLQTNNNEEPFILAVGADGNYLLDDGSEVQLMALSQHVTSYLGDAPDKPVYIRADESVASGLVVKAMVQMQKAGAKNIGIMAEVVPSNDTNTGTSR